MRYEIEPTTTSTGEPRFQVRIISAARGTSLLASTTGRVRKFKTRDLAERAARHEFGIPKGTT